MIIVAGHLRVDPADRDHYLDGCHEVIRQARSTEGCLDFHLSPDPIELDRINVFERWNDPEVLATFRGSGPSDDQAAMIRSASVDEYHVEPGR